jgi:nitronate monooxygenase
MPLNKRFLAEVGIENPVILAPLGGGPSTPELVAAVSNAGGLGTLAAAYLTAEQIEEEVRRIRQLTSRPFGINLFSAGYDKKEHGDPSPMLQILAEAHQKLGIAAPVLPEHPANPFPDQFQAVIEAHPRLFSFTFGNLDRVAASELRAIGTLVFGTATSVREAQILEDDVDAIIAQGSEAGAHRGTFAGSFEDAMVPTLQLVRDIRRVSEAPVIASGGIMDGRDIAAAIDAGAVAVQIGTAFLACPESGASAAYKHALLSAKQDTTVITRAFSGRPARGLRNQFIETMEGKEDAILPYPLQNALTRPMRTAAAKQGHSGYLSLWAGQGVMRIRQMPAGELVQTLVREMETA